ncbi:hypothetical protein Bca101_060453 [Brassica carinata]
MLLRLFRVSIKSHQCRVSFLPKKTTPARKLVVACSSSSSGTYPISAKMYAFPKMVLLSQSFQLANDRTFLTLSTEPLLVKAAKGQPVTRPPAWMMRQAGGLGKLSDQTVSSSSPTSSLLYPPSVSPSTSKKSKDLRYSLPSERTEEDLKRLHPIDLGKLRFVGDSLKILRGEVREHAVVLGFVGAPWTIATYIVEGMTPTYTVIKSMSHTAPNVLRALLSQSHLSKAVTEYAVYQVEHGAHCIQIFDSLGGQLTPEMWEHWSKPYIEEIIDAVKRRCPETPIVFYISGNGGLLERMIGTGADVTGL